MKSALADLYHAHVAERQPDDGASPRRDRVRPAPPPLRHPPHLLRRRPDAPFHPTPHFAHWAPVEGPGHVLEFRPGKKPRLVRYQPRDFWYEPPHPAPDFVAAEIDVVDAATPDAVWAAVGTNGATDRVPRRARSDEAAARGIPADAVNPKGLVARLDWERSYKSAYEVETLAEATVPAARGFRAAEAAFREGATEMEVHHAFLAAAGVMEDAAPLPDDHRLRRALRDAPLPRQAGDLGRAREGDARRRGRRRPRLRLRHHPDLRGRRVRPALPRTSSPGWRRSRRSSPRPRGPG